MTNMSTPDLTHDWVPRALDLPGLLAKRSHFLLGPRQTGKTSLVHRSLKDAKVYDLLDTSVYLALNQNPGRLAEELAPGDRIVVIDEIQRLPELLNEVHRLIETRGLRFLLTGSSARKLRRGGVNLLGGRARTKNLHPLTFKELGDRFDLARAMARGLLPSIYFSDDPSADLRAYAGLYLQQEIVAEGVTRNVPAFSRFLKVAALCNWRSTSGFEVDFIIGDHTAVEVKAKETVSLRDLKPLRALGEEKKLKRLLCVCLESRPRKVEGVFVLPFKKFLEALWEGQYR